MRTNKIVWMGLGVMILLIAVVLINSNKGSNEKTTKEIAGKKPAEAAPVLKVDGDTIDETLKQVQARYDGQVEENKALKAALAELNDRIAAQEAKDGSAKGDNRIDRLLGQLGTLQSNVEHMTSQLTEQQRRYDQTSANGYVFSGAEGAGESDRSTRHNKNDPVYLPPRMEGYVGVSPMAPAGSYSGGALDRASLGLAAVSNHGDTLARKEMSREKILKEKEKKDEVTPHYTIPARSTLLDAIGMTAIIGRVPVGDTLKSPFPVKIIVGNKNLATNGLRIPGLKGIVFEGIASGNWNLACASVSLSAATFTFEDGRVQHLLATKGESNEVASLTPVGALAASRPIGYISNPQGVPCIPGKRITDAHKQLATMSFFGMAASYFEAKAEAEKETVSAGLGTVSAVTGDKDAFVNNRTAQDTTARIQDFYERRNRDTFDAIVVPAGEKVVIHITSDLLIDYHTGARKLVYHNETGAQHASQLD
jgi:integrating conjugative element protein (TIGR03752 family)